MPRGNRGPLGEVVMYPLDHPGEVAKTAAVVVGTFIVSGMLAQASHVLAEHGGLARIKAGE